MAEAPTPIIDQTLSNDGFWPGVPVRRWVEGYRISTTDYREELVRSVLVQAMIDTNKALRPAKAAAIGAGFGSLADWIDANPGDVIAGEPLALECYLSAVYNLAKAATVKPLAALQRRAGSTNEDAAIAADSYDSYFRDQAQSAIASLLDIFEPDAPHATDSGVFVAGL